MALPPENCGPVLIADDDEKSRRELGDVFEAAGYRIREAASGHEAVEAAKTEMPCAAILEIPLIGLSGYEVCRTLRADLGPDLPIVFVSGSRTESYDRVAGLLIGADDYVVKPFAPDELLTRVRRLIRRSSPIAAPVAQKLTPRELEVLRLLADGLSQEDIAALLVISSRTVGTHIEHILSKLGVHNRTQAVALAFRHELLETG